MCNFTVSAITKVIKSRNVCANSECLPKIKWVAVLVRAGGAREYFWRAGRAARAGMRPHLSDADSLALNQCELNIFIRHHLLLMPHLNRWLRWNTWILIALSPLFPYTESSFQNLTHVTLGHFLQVYSQIIARSNLKQRHKTFNTTSTYNLSIEFERPWLTIYLQVRTNLRA